MVHGLRLMKANQNLLDMKKDLELNWKPVDVIVNNLFRAIPPGEQPSQKFGRYEDPARDIFFFFFFFKFRHFIGLDLLLWGFVTRRRRDSIGFNWKWPQYTNYNANAVIW